MTLDHLSASSLSQYRRCAHQWYLVRVEGLRLAPGAALVRGTAAHSGLEHNFRVKELTREDAPVEEVLDATRDAFTEGAGEVEDWQGSTPGEVLDSTVEVVRHYHLKRARELFPMPGSVEGELVVHDPAWPVPMLGYTDMVDESLGVIDFKTKSRKPSQPDIDGDLGAIFYEFATDQPVTWDALISGSTPRVASVTKSDKDREAARSLIAMMQQAVLTSLEAGVFAPALESEWMCSRRWCGFYATTHCPYTRRNG